MSALRQRPGFLAPFQEMQVVHHWRPANQSAPPPVLPPQGCEAAAGGGRGAAHIAPAVAAGRGAGRQGQVRPALPRLHACMLNRSSEFPPCCMAQPRQVAAVLSPSPPSRLPCCRGRFRGGRGGGRGPRQRQREWEGEGEGEGEGGAEGEEDAEMMRQARGPRGGRRRNKRRREGDVEMGDADWEEVGARGCGLHALWVPGAGCSCSGWLGWRLALHCMQARPCLGVLGAHWMPLARC